MRKGLLALLVMVALSSPVIAGIGIHLNYDMTNVEAGINRASFEEAYAEVRRNESDNPIGVGLDITFDKLPMVELVMSLEYARVGYTLEYEDPRFGITTDELTYWRAGMDASAIATVFSLPPGSSLFALYAGAGVSMMVVNNVVDEDRIEAEIDNALDLDGEDYAAVVSRLGFHGILGVKIEPPALPVSFRIMGKYYKVTALDADTPDTWLTLSAGVVLTL